MNTVQLTPKILTKKETQEQADIIVKNLLEQHDGIQAMIIAKSMHALLSAIVENDQLKDAALNSTNEKQGILTGAKWELRAVKEYSYNAPAIDFLEKEIEKRKEKIKTIKNIMHKFGNYVDSETGAINTANLLSEGQRLYITLPKE